MKNLALIPLLIAMLVAGMERFVVRAPVMIRQTLKAADDVLEATTGRSSKDYARDGLTDPMNIHDVTSEIRTYTQDKASKQSRKDDLSLKEQIKRDNAEFQQELYRALEQH